VIVWNPSLVHIDTSSVAVTLHRRHQVDNMQLKHKKLQGRSEGSRRPFPPSSIEWSFFNEKNWLCWDVGPALFSKVTLFSQSQVLCSVGLKYLKYMDPAAGKAQVLRATTKKVVNVLEKKVHPRSVRAPPQCKMLATRLRSYTGRPMYEELYYNIRKI